MAGRKFKFGTESTTIAFRVPKKHKDAIKKAINQFLKQFQNDSKTS